MDDCPRRVWFWLGLVVALSVLADVRPAAAGCNLIPGTEKTFNSSLGLANRPFAAPGERVGLRVRPCDSASSGLTDTATDHIVTVVFTPASGPRHAVVLTAGADCSALTAQLAACGSQLSGGGTALCLPGAAGGLEITEPNGVRQLNFRFPDTDAACVGGPKNGKPCIGPNDCPSGTCDPDDDNITLAGPVRIGVTAPGDPLPCGLANQGCAGRTGMRACIDGFFANDGGCGTSVPLSTFPQFTALPPPNPYHLDCFQEDPPCNPLATDLRFAVDGAGNLLFPVAWQGVLIPSRVPIPRLLRSRFKSPLPFTVPDQVFVGSFTAEGGSLPPIFEPQLDPTVIDQDVVTLAGSVDVPYTILRLARRHGSCQNGANDGARCSADTDCPGGTCITSCVGAPATACSSDGQCGANGPCGRLFNFGTGGPLTLPREPDGFDGFCQLAPHGACTVGGPLVCTGADNLCVAYALEAQLPVTLQSLGTSTSSVRSFLVRETVDQQQRNGDNDLLDTVVTLRNRQTGQGQPLGAAAGCGLSTDPTPEGRAVVEITEPPFHFAALALENNLLAFLESEAGQNNCYANGDDDAADSILRVFQLNGGEIAITPARAVDPALRVNGRSLAVSDGRVFFRTSEVAMGAQNTERVSVGVGGAEAEFFDAGIYHPISRDGRYVAFSSQAGNLLGGGADTNATEDVFLRDRQAATTERVSVGPAGLEADGGSDVGDMTPDGRYISFRSIATNLLGPGGDTNACFGSGTPGDCSDIFVRDRMAGTTERVSVGIGGVQSNDGSQSSAISDDGRYVAFLSQATNLLGPGEDTNGVTDVFVRDRQAGTTERVNVGPGGLQADGIISTGSFAMSADGRYVAFESSATNVLGPGNDINGGIDVFVHDRQTHTTTRVSVGPGGAEADNISFGASMSPDGRFVTFQSLATNLEGPFSDNNLNWDVYLHDRQTGVTERVSRGSYGADGDGASTTGQGNNFNISADGRYVAFMSDATNLLGPGADTNGIADAFVRDRLTATTTRVNVGPGGVEADNGAFSALSPYISEDGWHVVFASDSDNLLGPGGDTNVRRDVFVRSLDSADPLAVDNLLFDDNALDDTVLEVLDTNVMSPTVTTLCPAGDVAVAAGRAAFLRPEAAMTGPATPLCPKGPLNGDGLVDDDVVHLWPGSGSAENLRCAATAVALSSTWVGALASEPGQGTNLNGDSDSLDAVAQVHRVAGPFGTACTGGGSTWVNTSQAADSIAVTDSAAVFISPEAAQGGSPGGLNAADADTNDRVLQVYALDASGNSATAAPCAPSPNSACTTGVRNAAEEFVIGDVATAACGNVQLVAFRTSEAAEGNSNLNDSSNGQPTGDPDTSDFVLQVYDAVSGTLVNTGQAAIRCDLEACDPRLPYRVSGSTVKFLTFEPDQGVGADLSGEGSTTDVVLQVFDFCTGRNTVIGRVSPGPGRDPLDDSEQSRTLLAPAGRCDTGVLCDFDDSQCSEGSFCQHDTCDLATMRCRRQSSIVCGTDLVCRRCLLREPATCLDDVECPAGSTCEDQLITAVTSVADQDDDGVPDDQDNCPALPNTDQADADDDAVGDACDVDVCATTMAVTDPRARLKMKTFGGKGKLTVKMVIPLVGYVNAPVGVLISDGDTPAIASASVGALPPKGASGALWQFKTKASGLQKVALKNLGGGQFQVKAKSKKWFTAAAANQTAAATTVTVNIAGQCFTHALTAKLD